MLDAELVSIRLQIDLGTICVGCGPLQAVKHFEGLFVHFQEITPLVDLAHVYLVEIVQVNLLADKFFPKERWQIKDERGSSPYAHTHQDAQELKLCQLSLPICLRVDHEQAFTHLLFPNLVCARLKQIKQLLVGGAFEPRRL